MSEIQREIRRGRAQGGGSARRALRRGEHGHPVELPFGPANYVILISGLVAVVVGFLLLARREITLSPILLVTGYCLLIPVGLLYRPQRQG